MARKKGTASPQKGKKKGLQTSGGASTPNRGTKTPGANFSEAGALNPPFDPRMRRIGSPLNQSNRIKRGWIQKAVGETYSSSNNATSRVNFMLNPASLELSSQMDASVVDMTSPASTMDPMHPYYTGTPISTSVGLLYDRTYELFSEKTSSDSGGNMANTYGVWADIAAWYTYLGMYEQLPRTWNDSLIASPIIREMHYLFVGPSMVYYGFVTGIAVGISHWTQNMVPQRCKIDVAFSVMPRPATLSLKNGGIQSESTLDVDNSWVGALLGGGAGVGLGVGDVDPEGGLGGVGTGGAL